MKILNCNVRALGLSEKRGIIHDFIVHEYVDVLCLQETKKDFFLSQFLKSIVKCYDTWKFIPSVGTTGGS
jgi:exonuclease III